MVLSPDFSEFIALLNAHDVDYLVVGGYAVGFHGHPRYTKDLDVWVGFDEMNAQRLMRALKDFGFGSVGLSAADFTAPNHTIQLGYPPLRIDILTSVSGIVFDECLEQKSTTVLGEITVHFIGLDCLKKNKKAVGRHQDLADLEKLK